MSWHAEPPTHGVDWITLQGFKSIERIEQLSIAPINVLIGPNGSGKTNLIEALLLLQEIRRGRLQEYVVTSGGAHRILHFGSTVTNRLRIHVSFFEHAYQYEIILTSTDSDRLSPLTERGYVDHPDAPHPISPLDFRPRIGESEISRPTFLTDDPWRTEQGVDELVDHWPDFQLLNATDTSRMKRMARINDNRGLRSDGSNLAPFLYFLRSKESGSYEMIRRTVRLVAPFFDDFILEPRALDSDTIRLEWRHRGSDAYFDAASLSDGSLRFIALATLLLQPTRLLPSVIIIDEPEFGLHPYAITMLCSLVKQAATRAQVILATQSPLLLDHFEPEDVLVTERVNGRSEFNRLDRAELEEWLKDYSLGQLWEKNEIGGRPSREEGLRDSAR